MTATAPPSADPEVSGALRRRTSTPAGLRVASLVTVALLAVTAITGLIAARALDTSTNRARTSTGPVLVATQDVIASIAEADAASAAVFLSGAEEDREQRRLYELALERTTAQLEEVSRLVGDAVSDHDSIKRIAADVTTYAGIVESARLANTAGLPGAPDRLLAAIDIVQRGIVPEVGSITTRAQDRLDDDVAAGRGWVLLAVAAAVATLTALAAGQVHLTRRTNRLLNLPLLGATLVLAVAAGWLLTGWVRQQQALDIARERGYDSIALTARIQTTAFSVKTLESLALITGGTETDSAAERAALAEELADVDVLSPTLIADARRGNAAGTGLLLDANRTADSTREQAASTELLIRWGRYLETSRDIQIALDADDADTAVALAVGPGNADFNGFNTSVESVLSDNRAQFTDELAAAADHTRRLPVIVVALPVVVAMATLWGYGIRIREYRR